MNTFSDVFESAESWNHEIDVNHPATYRAGAVRVGHYCMRANGNSLRVKPTKATLDHIKKNMISVPHDQIYFEVINHSDGTSSIYAKYNVILGSRLLAVVPTSSCPPVAVSHVEG